MTEQSEHLSSAQIENYGNRTSGAGPEAAQRDEHQRANHQSGNDRKAKANDQRIDDRQINDQRIHDQQIDDLKISDLKIDDQQLNDQRVEAHLADCASCRNRLLDFHRSLFGSPTYQPEPDRPKAADPKNVLKNNSPEHDSSLPSHSSLGDSPSGYLASGHSPSGHSSSGHLPLGQRSSGQKPADSNLEGSKPTDSALADSKFANPKDPADPQVRTAPTPECPSDDALRQLAAGLTPEDAAAKLTQHAATCNHCGPLLRTYTEIFSDDFSSEELAMLDRLKSASPAWQRQTARKMLPERTALGSRDSSSRSTPWTVWKWVPAFSFLLLVAAGASWVYPLLVLHKATLAVEAEYRKGRPMKYRAAEVPYGPYEGERGSRDSRDSSTAIKPNPGKAPVLAANAAFLVYAPDGYTNAKLILEEALRHHRSLPLLNNLAVAYAMEADNVKPANEEERKQQRKIYDQALQLTEEILDKNSSDPAALFNQALILERLDKKQKAIEDLEKLGRIEQDLGWRKEAAEKLQLLRSLP